MFERTYSRKKALRGLLQAVEKISICKRVKRCRHQIRLIVISTIICFSSTNKFVFLYSEIRANHTYFAILRQFLCRIYSFFRISVILVENHKEFYEQSFPKPTIFHCRTPRIPAATSKRARMHKVKYPAA